MTTPRPGSTLTGLRDLTVLDATGRIGGALAFADGRVEAFDAPPDALPLPGLVAVPGLIDAHLHALLGGLRLEQLDLTGVRSRAAFEEAVSRRHHELPAGAWLEAWGWSSENWPSRAEPDRSWLSGVADRPTICWRMDHHACVVNDAVLRRLDCSSDPPGGVIARDETGRPTGLLLESAAWRMARPLVPTPDVDRRRRALRAAARHLAAHGLTTVGSMEYTEDVRDVHEALRGELEVRFRVTILDRDWPIDVAYGTSFRNDDRLAVIGYKAFLDGTLGSRTARMLEAYADDPGNRGVLVELAEEGHLDDWARLVARHDLSPSMHAIGDAAVRMALDAIDLAGADAPRARIEHAQTIHPDDLPRFRGRVASMQPLHKADDGRYAERRLGAARMNRFFPFRSLLSHGATLAFGSDWPIVTPDPMAGMRAAITGLDLDDRPVATDQNLTPAEALHAYTVGAADALGAASLGHLAAGAAADVTILDRDPLTADWSTEPPRVVMTIVGGRVAYAGEPTIPVGADGA